MSIHQVQVVVTHAVGLHARPSVAFTKLAKKLGAPVEVAAAPDGPWFNAASIVKVMALKVPQGAILYMRGEGEAARAAMDALVDLVKHDFGLGGGGDAGSD